eukprot:2767219-Pyramimonas_sp.AAC.1
MSPVTSGFGKGHSVARGSRNCSIMTTINTLSAWGESGCPPAPISAPVSSVSVPSCLSKAFRFSIPGCTLCRHLQVVKLHAAGNCWSAPRGVQ